MFEQASIPGLTRIKTYLFERNKCSKYLFKRRRLSSAPILQTILLSAVEKLCDRISIYIVYNRVPAYARERKTFPFAFSCHNLSRRYSYFSKNIQANLTRQIKTPAASTTAPRLKICILHLNKKLCLKP